MMAWQQQHWDNNDRKHNFNVTRQQYNDNNDDNDDNDNKLHNKNQNINNNAQ
jgi:hypothetical protein